MATIIRELDLNADVDAAWAAIRDVGAVHVRLAPGFVKEARLENGTRHVVFANDLAIDEAITGIDEEHRRVAYSAQNRGKHHQASMQVMALGKGHCRFIWITDVLPDDVAPRFASMMDQALPVIKKPLESKTNLAQP